MTRDAEALLALLARLRGRRVVVLGDLVSDEFIYGEMKRVYGDVARTSREVAFGLMLRQREVHRVPGGGANAINNLAALGARPIPFGIVGADAAGRELRGYFRRRGVSTSGLLVVRNWITPVKSRILAGSSHAAAQQVLRLDREPAGHPPAAALRRLAAAARQAMKSAAAVLIADYGYGAASPAVVRALLRGRPRLPVVVDSRYQVRAYRRVTAVTPSVPELEEAYQWPNASEADVARRLGRRLLEETRAGAVLVTRGRQGMLLLQRGGRAAAIPAFGTDQVVDVTGAGDTVAAAFTAALAAGADFETAARLANIAGGLVVRKRGTATVSAAEIRAALSV
ncbi:MAG: bifunctional heptose 7-phosphate kinase/heptose 1-phosphate adenyltransferase [Candidatus Acidiferrales bacterium]